MELQRPATDSIDSKPWVVGEGDSRKEWQFLYSLEKFPAGLVEFLGFYENLEVVNFFLAFFPSLFWAPLTRRVLVFGVFCKVFFW